MKIIPLQGYDIILGIDWLGAHSPMHIHWQERWMKFNCNNQEVKLQGLLPEATMGPPVSQHQLQAFDKTDSILYLVQLYEVSSSVLPTQ